VKEEIAGKILDKLEKQEEEEGNLPLLLEFYRALLLIQLKVNERRQTINTILAKNEIDERIRKGIPLLCFSEMDLDWKLLGETFAEVASVYRARPELFGPISGASIPILTEELVKAWYEGTELPESIPAADERLVRAMIQATMNPFLSSYSRAMIGSFNIEFWRRGYCPVCGGSPDFSFLDRERASRWLLCSRCDTEWVFQRLECPFCGCQEQGILDYFADDKELYRLYSCQRCLKYLKAIDLRKTEEDILLPLERLLTIDMDRQAREKGLGNN
jgi:FdhE protein